MNYLQKRTNTDLFMTRFFKKKNNTHTHAGYGLTLSLSPEVRTNKGIMNISIFEVNCIMLQSDANIDCHKSLHVY